MTSCSLDDSLLDIVYIGSLGASPLFFFLCCLRNLHDELSSPSLLVTTTERSPSLPWLPFVFSILNYKSLLHSAHCDDPPFSLAPSVFSLLFILKMAFLLVFTKVSVLLLLICFEVHHWSKMISINCYFWIDSVLFLSNDVISVSKSILIFMASSEICSILLRMY